MTKVIVAFAVIFVLMACNNAVETTNTQKATNQDTAAMAIKPTDSLPVYTAAMLDSKKDLVCGMPVTAGVSDTAHYKGKAYGFCAKECKDEFLKSPEQYLSVK